MMQQQSGQPRQPQHDVGKPSQPIPAKMQDPQRRAQHKLLWHALDLVPANVQQRELAHFGHARQGLEPRAGEREHAKPKKGAHGALAAGMARGEVVRIGVRAQRGLCGVHPRVAQVLQTRYAAADVRTVRGERDGLVQGQGVLQGELMQNGIVDLREKRCVLWHL